VGAASGLAGRGSPAREPAATLVVPDAATRTLAEGAQADLTVTGAERPHVTPQLYTPALGGAPRDRPRRKALPYRSI
jgi:hypothetical protein